MARREGIMTTTGRSFPSVSSGASPKSQPTTGLDSEQPHEDPTVLREAISQALDEEVKWQRGKYDP